MLRTAEVSGMCPMESLFSREEVEEGGSKERKWLSE